MGKIDAKEFRNALGAFATGVTIITAHGVGGRNVGVTANSFNSVSMDPPLVLWSLDKNSGSLDIFSKADYFAVHILSADQVSLSNRFASRLEDKYEGIEFISGLGDVPLLEGCAARFVCQNKFQYEGGDHIIFVGEVEDFEHFGRRALLYHQGCYAVSDPHPAVAPPKSGQETKGGFVDDYLNYLLAKAAQLFEQHFEPVLEGAGLSHVNWRVLAVLSDKSSMTAEQIANIIIIPVGQLGQILEEMETKFLIKKQNDTYSLSDSGEEVAIELLAGAKAHETDVLGTFKADEALMLKSALKKLINWVGSEES